MENEEEKQNIFFFENEINLYYFLHKYIFDSLGNFLNNNFNFKSEKEKVEIIKFIFNCSDIKKFIKNKEKIVHTIKRQYSINPGIHIGNPEDSIFIKRDDLLYFIENKKEELLHNIIKKLNKNKKFNLVFIKEKNKVQWEFVNNLQNKK